MNETNITAAIGAILILVAVAVMEYLSSEFSGIQLILVYLGGFVIIFFGLFMFYQGLREWIRPYDDLNGEE